VEGYFSDIVFENFINRQRIMDMGPPPWALISKRGVVLLLLIPTAMILLSASSMTNAEIIYKPGDWLLYRFTFNFDGWECTYLYRVTVRNIKGTNVLYSLLFEKMEKGDDPLICQPLLPVRIEVPFTSDISQERPKPWIFFINPAYTGEHTTSTTFATTTVRYYKGILTYLEERREITGSGLRIELVDTSIQELKASITPSGISITMIGLLVVVLAILITVIAIFIVVKRRHKTTETPLNQSQVA
jgi:hypothetical protein